VEPEAQFKIDELAEATDLSRRTIHHYIAEGIIPRARGGAGPAAYYDEEHYLRLRILTRLKGMGLSLSTIRDSLNDLSLEEMREVLGLPEDLDYRAIWAHVAMKRSGTPESFRVEEAELNETQDFAGWDGPPPDASAPRGLMRKIGRARQARRDKIQASKVEVDLLSQDVYPHFSAPGSIRRDSEFVDGLARQQPPESEESPRTRHEQPVDDSTAPRMDASLEELEDKHHIAAMMTPAAYHRGTAARTSREDEPLHPEMDSQPWRRVRVSSDLEISYRESDDPLTRKKLRHLLDFVHRLFRLERSWEGRTPEVLPPDELNPETFIAEERPGARRAPQHDSKSMDRSGTPVERPQAPEEES
jgi:DNA-binding transcriptional MerR regulator